MEETDLILERQAQLKTAIFLAKKKEQAARAKLDKLKKEYAALKKRLPQRI